MSFLRSTLPFLFLFSICTASLGGEVTCEQVLRSTVFKNNTDLVTAFISKTRELDRDLLLSYAELLDVYYPLKAKSDSPYSFHNPLYFERATPIGDPSADNKELNSMIEFNYGEYLKFKDQLDSHPKLKNNLFLKKLKEYGLGGANDVFQRIPGYAVDELGIDSKSRIAIELYLHIGSPMSGEALQNAALIFATSSHNLGYPKNGNTIYYNSPKNWDDAINAGIQKMYAKVK